MANESLLRFGRVAHVVVGLEGSRLASVHHFFSTLSSSQLLGYRVVTLMHLERSHPRGGMDLAPVRDVPLDPTSHETLKSQVSAQIPIGNRVVSAAGLRASL